MHFETQFYRAVRIPLNGFGKEGRSGSAEIWAASCSTPNDVRVT